MLSKVIGIDHSKNFPNLSASPFCADIPATITFADAAISEPLPPKQEPSDNAHQTGIISSRPPISASMDFRVGIMVATNGMLSITEDNMADNHKIIIR